MKIGVYGVGNFGFAIVKHLSNSLNSSSKTELVAFDRNKKIIENLIKKRTHLYHHKTIKIKNNVTFTNNAADVFKNADIVVLAVTSSAIVEVLTSNEKYYKKNAIVLNTAKSLDIKSGSCYSTIVSLMPNFRQMQCRFAVISGGTIASDLFHHEPLGVDIGCTHIPSLKLLKKTFTSDNLNVYTTTDVRGIEYAGAFKNVISILAGIVNGCGFSYGSETHLITRAAHETINLLKTKTPIKESTFSIESQCWGNDLWLSCTGNTRNREFGILLGKGYSTKRALDLMKRRHKTVEGVHTVQSLKKIKKLSQYPIYNGIYNIVINNKKPKQTILKLMASNSI